MMFRKNSVVPVSTISSTTSCKEKLSTNSVEKALQDEKNKHIIQSEKRSEIFRTILDNSCSNFNSPKYIFTCFCTIIGTVAMTFFYTLIPIHNVIQSPEYWYEYPMQVTMAFLPLYACHILYDLVLFMDIESVKNYRTFVILLVSMVVSTWITVPILYAIWTFLLTLRYPIPFIGYIHFSLMFITEVVTIWFCFPYGWRQNQGFRKRLRMCALTVLFMNLQVLQYLALTELLNILPVSYQWISAFFLPFVKEFDVWFITKLASMSTNGDLCSGKLYAAQTINVGHALFITYSAGSIATLSTSLIIIGIDVLTNIYTAGKIVYCKNRKDVTEENTNKIVSLLHDLVIAESVETMVPICYAICFIVAYVGPNSVLIGGVQNSYWHFSAVKDLEYTMKILCAFFVFDFSSLLISAFLLWHFSRINFYRAYGAIQHEFALPFAVNMAVQLNGVKCKA